MVPTTATTEAGGSTPGASGACTCFKLRSLSRRVTQLYDDALAPAGLTVTQFSLIAHARAQPGGAPPTLSELAQRMVTDRTTLTRNLKPLVASRYVKLACGSDARRRCVSVTAAGEAAFQAARPLWKRAQAMLRERVGSERVASLHELIDAILPELR